MLRNHLVVFSALLFASIASVGRAQPIETNGATRSLSLGIMALGDYEGDGAGVAVEWPVARFSPRFSLGVGGMVGMQQNTEPHGTVRFTNYTIPVLGIGNLQYQHRPDSRLSLYGGLTAGITHVSVRNYQPGLGLDERGTHLSVGTQIGARYRLANHMGLMAQLGVGDMPALFAGVVVRW